MPKKRKQKKKSNREVGIASEEKASKFLQEKGYEILTKNFSTRFGEIDIISCKEDVLYLVEVKYRKTSRFGFPVEAVGRGKLEKIKKTGQVYITKHNLKHFQTKIIVVSILDETIKLINVETW